MPVVIESIDAHIYDDVEKLFLDTHPRHPSVAGFGRRHGSAL